MLHREILNLCLGTLVFSALVSASVSAAGEWIPYNGTFPGMVGSLCSEAHPATYIAVRSRDEWVAYWEPVKAADLADPNDNDGTDSSTTRSGFLKVYRSCCKLRV
jgi:hypothetical protein